VTASSKSTSKFTCPRISVWPMAGKQAATGSTRSSHQRAQPAGCVRTPASGDVRSSAVASQWTASARNSRFRQYHTATVTG
jgi:hypothetical protein